MVKIGGILGGIAGFAFGGVIGGIIGFAIGNSISGSVKTNINAPLGGQTTRTDFAVSLMVLIASVMKADGRVVKSELDFVKNYLRQVYSPNEAQELTLLLRDILKKDIPLAEVCTQIRANMQYHSRLELIHFLYKLALSDGELQASENQTIAQICAYLGITPNDVRSIQAMFGNNIDSAYQVLEVTKDATDDEIKKAYKKMAIKYHPDKVSHLGEEVQKSATEKFKKVNDAYNRIKKERNIK